ncbi:MAG: threonine synthase [Chloroflexota bacterium]
MKTRTQERGVLARYGSWLPISDRTPPLTLGEGSTPLVRANHLQSLIGCDELYFKLEGCNPTGSFKDRGMVMAVAKALEAGGKAVMCASTGNTSASAAAYAAHSGIDCIVAVPAGNIALGKMAQALAYGAMVLAVDGNFDDALTIVRALTDKHPIVLVNSINPFRIEGQKTAAFEVCDDLGDAPQFLAIPVGNAGNITAYWKGFREYQQAGRSTRLPRLLGFQAEGAAPIVRNEVVPKPQTVATAIKIGNPASWKSAVAARDESGGLIDLVSDDEIIAAYQALAAKEGIFVEPASAASVAGIFKMARLGRVDFRGSRVVCVLTGHGLKDPDTAVRVSPPFRQLPADLSAIEKELGLGEK